MNIDWEKEFPDLTFGDSADSVGDVIDDLRSLSDDIESVVVVVLFKSGLRDILGYWSHDETAVGMLEFAANDLLSDRDDASD